MAHLRPCTVCSRHVRSDETRCPFCEAVLPATAVTNAAPEGRLSRAALMTVGAALAAASVTACGNGTSAVPDTAVATGNTTAAATTAAPGTAAPGTAAPGTAAPAASTAPAAAGTIAPAAGTTTPVAGTTTAPVATGALTASTTSSKTVTAPTTTPTRPGGPGGPAKAYGAPPNRFPGKTNDPLQ